LPTTSPALPSATTPEEPLLSRSDTHATRQQLQLACRPLHRRFAEAYVKHGCGREAKIKAAIEVGYSIKNQKNSASAILGRPEVQAYVRYLMAEKAKRDEISPDWIRGRLMEEATFFGKGSSHAARIRACELLGRDEGMFQEETPNVVVPVKVFVGINADEI
jgi:hypothetical protein